MATSKKLKRIAEERNKVEQYIPMDISRIRQVTEVPVKQLSDSDIITIESPGKLTKNKKVRKTKIGKLRTRKIDEDEQLHSENKNKRLRNEVESEEEFETPRGKDYILIITEKPQAAMKIAAALGNARKYSENQVPYYELTRNNEKIVVACAVGHLFTLTSKEKGFPVFNIEWQPNYKVRKKDFTRKYYSLLGKLAKGAKEFIIATDYDIEGEVIGWNVARFIAKQKDADRMKFSTLTKDELEKAYETKTSTINWGQAIAGETRHFLDWMYGINLSRALMAAIKSTGKFKIMSIGRVQGPALNLIVQRELEIKKFIQEPYWQVFIIVDGIELKYVKDITKKADLIPFKNLKGKQVQVSTETSEQAIHPPAPFDLTTLQTEAYKFHNITPSRTLQIAQNLYLAGIISYPRTSSQKIPESINPQAIIKRLSKRYDTKLCSRAKPIEGNKSDPAHPSIYPTGEFEELEGEDKKIYELIARRFLSCFCEDAIIANKTITALYQDYRFTAKGLEVKKKGWMEMYKTKLQEKELRDLKGNFKIDDSRIEEKMTQPPNRYSAASLVRELEKRNLGTKATRASIVETLYDRGYIKEQSIQATPIGISLIETLEKHSPIIIDEKLTRNFEKEMNEIQESKKDLNKKEQKVLDEAKQTIIEITGKLKKEEKEIGQELVKANEQNWQQEREANTLQQCPVCKKGNLRILYNKKWKRSFVACSAYPDCKTTFSLPPNGAIKKTDQVCQSCNFPMLMRLSKGKRPWIFCFNKNCPSRLEQQEQQKKVIAEEKSESNTEE